MVSFCSLFNRVIRRINNYSHAFYYNSITLLEYLYLRLIGVNIKRGVKFRGWCSVFYANNSRIEIGQDCAFNSSGYTNHIGLNHRCILTTMGSHSEIIIGDNTGFSSTSIISFCSIHIGNNVRVGANCIIMDGDFHMEDSRTPNPSPILIEDNVWLGANVIVMKGVTIGENSFIGINSVVTKDIPSNCVAAGNPCKVLRSLLQE